MKKSWLLALVGGLLCAQAQAVTEIIMDGDPGDPIGAGQHYELTSSNGDFSFNITASKIFLRHSSDGVRYFDFEFTPPTGQLLSPAPYFNAVHIDSATAFEPGMAITNETTGCDEISGHFLIYEFDLSGTNPQIALDFEQYCDSRVDRLAGTIRINSNVATPYVKPVAYAGADISAREGMELVLDASASFANSGTLDSYQWSQIAGPAAIVSLTDTETLTIETPAQVPLGGIQLLFSLIVTDSNGQSASDQINVRVKSKSDPQTYAILASDPGDALGLGQSWSFNEYDATFAMTSNINQGVSLAINGDSEWVINLAAPGSAPLSEGVYLGARRYPFQDEGEAGLNVAGAGRQCSNINGTFQVDEISWKHNQPQSLLATFEQHCEGATPAMSGRISINALHPSVPTANAGEKIEQLEGTSVNLNGSASFDNDGVIIRYQWRQLGGPAVRLIDDDTVRASFLVKDLPDRALDERYLFELLIEDDLGYMARDQVTVTLMQNNFPPIAVDDEFIATDPAGTVFDLIKNDVDEDGTINPASIELIDDPAKGVVTIYGDGTIVYTANEPFEEADTFTYIIKDNDDAEAETAATVTVYYDETAARGGEYGLYTEPVNSGTGSISLGGLLFLFGTMLLRWAVTGSKQRAQTDDVKPTQPPAQPVV